ncbi:uncharacterized protein LOC114360497 [Ostrinia furnacalis]|uniref:uncharacterized protein LOC114360497 n=1 Tax=Ostrinia furnacalis TaxID=93504 RepID=UPI00103A5D23|nr:uncharacterized protein LOC114360497 [Ostrinia furnacalis]
MLVVTGDAIEPNGETQNLYRYIFDFQLHLISAQFPQHIDLQKVGEVKFNHEKYNVLRPTLHKVEDYFRNFMMRRDSTDFPTKRVFIDHNGFRHYWSGFEEVEKNLRKSETPSDVKNDTEIVTATNRNVSKQNSTVTKRLPKRRKRLKSIPSTNILRASNGTRTIAKTSFFCPFFGVVTMTTFLD